MHWIAPSGKDAANDTLAKMSKRQHQTPNLRHTRNLLVLRLLSEQVKHTVEESRND